MTFPGIKPLITGKINITSTWYFAVKKGIFVKSAGEENSNLKINMGAMTIPRFVTSKSSVEFVF